MRDERECDWFRFVTKTKKIGFLVLVISSYSISSKFETEIFRFVFSFVCSQAFTYILFSQTSLDYVSSMQAGPKKEYFLLSNVHQMSSPKWNLTAFAYF